MANQFMRAYEALRIDAHATEATFEAYCGRKMRRVPGMCTVIRLAVRLQNGKSREQAAAAEYLYRWRLVLDAEPRSADALWGVPHALGM